MRRILIGFLATFAVALPVFILMTRDSTPRAGSSAAPLPHAPVPGDPAGSR